MRPLKFLISFEDAKQIIDHHIMPVERTQRVSLLEAAGRVAAGEITSAIDIPSFDRAAMDGYAVRAEDTFGASKQKPRTFGLSGNVHAGEVSGAKVSEGSCVQIATGAMMPPGADAVVMVEYTEAEGRRIQITRPVYPGENVGRAGADIEKGTVILTDGALLTPAHIGSAAAAGLEAISVYVKPMVVVISTGDEVVRPPRPLAPGQLYDVNSFTTAALLASNGALTRLRGPCRDDPDTIRSCLEEEEADMMVFTGGSSVGERDVLIDALESSGEILFHGIAVKPGKPTLFARAGTRIVFGMPGYPTSCLSNGYMFLIPAIRKMARLPAAPRRTVPLPMGHRIVSTIGRHQFLTVRIEDGRAKQAFKESGAITSMSNADGYIEIPSNVDLIDKGEVVEVTLF